MNVNVLASIINGQFINQEINKKIRGVKTDSRNLETGDLFIALIGKNDDGHNYIKDALKRNPSAVVVCKKINIKTKVPIILVKDTYDALIKIGTFFRSKYDIPVIGITGSVGKTTTKEIISAILEKKYKVLKSEKNYNNHIGVPLTLTKLTGNYDVCVLEMGMNHLGEISKLSKMSKPNIGVITNIGTAHIGNLGSKKNIFKAKLEIIDGIQNGLLIVNYKDKLLKKTKYINTIKCGKKLKPYDIVVNDKVSFKLKINKKVYNFCYNSLNDGMIMNFIIAIQIGLLFDVNMADIQDAILKFQMPSERMEVITKNTTTIINDCYNASLESVTSSIHMLEKINHKKMLILGDILELGKFAPNIYKKLGTCLKKLKYTDILLVGDNVKNIKGNQYKYFNSNQEVIKYLSNLNLDDTTVLIKASRGMHLEEITRYLLGKL